MILRGIVVEPTRSQIVGFAFASLLAVFSTADVNAQEMDASRWYGRGVHQFFAGAYHDSIASLNTAAEAGSSDPRIYYFRGLANLALGDRSAAEDDFELGATLEFSSQFGSTSVSRSLERIQGQRRLMIERQRRAARLDAAREFRRRREARYGASPPPLLPGPASPDGRAAPEDFATPERPADSAEFEADRNASPPATGQEAEPSVFEPALPVPDDTGFGDVQDYREQDPIADAPAPGEEKEAGPEGGQGISAATIGSIFKRTFQKIVPSVPDNLDTDGLDTMDTLAPDEAPPQFDGPNFGFEPSAETEDVDQPFTENPFPDDNSPSEAGEFINEANELFFNDEESDIPPFEEAEPDAEGFSDDTANQLFPPIGESESDGQ